MACGSFLRDRIVPQRGIQVVLFCDGWNLAGLSDNTVLGNENATS